MKKTILLSIVMFLSSTIVKAYDYEYQRSLQARDSGEAISKPILKEPLNKDQKKFKTIQRRKNLEERRDSRLRGIRNSQGDIINMR